MKFVRNRKVVDNTSRLVARLSRPFLMAALGAGGLLSGADKPSPAPEALRQYCFGCHGKSAAGGINLQELTSHSSVGDKFQQWQKVVSVLEEKRMPPPKMRQPSDSDRQQVLDWIRSSMAEYVAKNAGDPGRVTVRRLTSAEYAYTIRDLTGLNLKFDADFANDTVGGEGFTNYGDVQFMADANLERYLAAARRVADHSVLGSGPLEFYDDAGKSGFELSAINRIQQIYTKHGFRATSGEGGKPYGLDKYSKAFYVAWRYRHRAAAGQPEATLASLAAKEGISSRFAEHIWAVVQDSTPTYPSSEVIDKWKKLPAPGGPETEQTVRAQCDEIRKTLVNWPRWLFNAGAAAEGGAGDERALVLTEESIKPATKETVRFIMRGTGGKPARAHFSLVSANSSPDGRSIVVWHKPMLRPTGKDRKLGEPVPLKSLLDEAAIARLGFGKRPDGVAIDADDFAMASDTALDLDIPLPAGAAGAVLQVEAQLAAGGAVIRATISSSEDVSRGRPAWALIGDPAAPGYQSWKDGVLEFAANLPQNSQGEATPSDKDPIPAPFDNTYNQPERDHYHAKLKYYRSDRFLVEKVLDDETKARLDHAWNDLLASFEYHDLFLQFVANKFKYPLKAKNVESLTDAELASMPAEVRKYASALRDEYRSVQKSQMAARPRHVEDCIELASRAWRRPLAPAEKDQLRRFYTRSTENLKLDHGKAVEALIARILVAPAFLYRLEQPAQVSGVRPLNSWEIATRLSYFLWSSAPDKELRRAAAAGELENPEQLQKQAKRMLADPKARRFATEFFGQWLGFYQFDQFRGVDKTRFPEFTDEVKSAMYEEAVSFFDHVVRKDRPVREIWSADYTFLNQALAKHYGVSREIKAVREMEMVEGASGFNRGGALRMGALLTATSAPLRTSPVKRGDWVLRRVLGTPTPPPPPDAGSIPADDKQFGGLTVKEKLEAHKRNATCAGCHTRIDPLGFPFEKYDSVGRWRDSYADGKPIDDTAALADKTPISGVDGLVAYLRSQEPQVLRNMSHKLIGYALGRTVIASDQPLVDKLVQAGGDASLSKLVSEIVTSRQFRYRREPDQTTRTVTPQTAVTRPVESTTKEGGI